MDWFKKILASITALAEGVGSIVDAVIPVAHGDRTKIGALIAVAAPVLCKALDPVLPAACGVVQSIGMAAGALVPLFALAGLVRK